jgi:hypothetical protein
MATVSVTARDSSGATATTSASYTVSTTPPPTDKVIIGMSAPRDLWAQRLSEVGATGIKARRIFADLTSNGRDQSDLIAEAVNAGMLPVLSYKLPRTGSGYQITEALNGNFDLWVTALGNYLASLNAPVAVVFHHEPRGDLTGPQFISLNKRYIPLVRKSANIKVGCFINGFLLDGSTSAKAEFASFSDAALLAAWDWFGIDAYHAGDEADPDPEKTPGARIRATRAWLDARGLSAKPIGFGEYNGFTASAVADAGEASLSVPGVWFSCVWNSTGGTFTPLTGARLTAFKATKADPRAVK